MNPMQKYKFKALRLILNISKVDSRTLKNIKAILSSLKTAADFLSGKELMYRITNATRSSSVVYDILNKLEKSQIIETKEVRSQGPLKKKRLFKVTNLGTLLLGALTSNFGYIEEAVKTTQVTYEDNPVLKFQAKVMERAQIFFETDFKESDNLYIIGILKGFSRSLKMDEIIFYANSELSPLTLDIHRKANKLEFMKKMQKVYTESLNMMEDYEKRVVFTHYKYKFNDMFLKRLAGHKLKGYFERIQKNPDNIHANCPMCQNIFSINYDEFVMGNFPLCSSCINKG